MKPYAQTDNYTLYLGDAWQVLDSLPENSVDAVVTDPPYEIGFMNKGWDNTGVAFNRTTWEKALRVLKPGGHLLAFNHSRTFHRMAVAIEDAGFEIRDTIMWLYGSGFPKSHDISKAIDRAAGAEREVIGTKKTRELPNDVPFGQGLIASHANAIAGRITNGQVEIDITAPATDKAKQWEGWGTALKPAYEPILMARKPIPSTVADNVLTHGVGGINIDGCRVGFGGETDSRVGTKTKNKSTHGFWQDNIGEGVQMYKDNGRFPANVIHDGSEEVVQGFPETNSGQPGIRTSDGYNNNAYGKNMGISKGDYNGEYGDSGSASRFFYTAKASKKDRDEGLVREAVKVNDGRKTEIDNAFQRGETPRRNIHPTVKPTDLMQYLIRLIAPKGATVLDLFMGSGSTGKAAMIENVEREANYHFIGIDRTEEYLPIAQARIEFGRNYAEEKPKADGVVHKNQIDLFSLL
jgi:DNA modification methylase